jgi:ATP-dependent Lon protease
VLCFVGPPGVGKTSIGRSIASALGRPFVSVSLGGVSDEAEIRGHRRTYVGAMPGRILQSLKSCGASNPVFMLDEVDKLVHNGHGDPASALLEALDPAQNHRFSDHYLELPFDLSSVLFIATANNLASVPAALRDRLEIVPFFSYADSEREEICRQFILPKALQDHGLHPDEVPLDGAVVRSLAHDYTREAGLRALEREAASLARKLARAVAEGTSLPKPIKHEDLVRLLGDPPLKRAPSALAVPGIVNGLVVTEYGGDVATVEVCLLEPLGSEPHIRLTGNLGEIMQESAGTALTCVRSLLGETRRFWRDVHIHFAEGSVPKEGTSAGLAIALALASALDEQPLPSDLAVTGEITLLGRTLAVGGIREKLLGARRAGIKRVILPQANLRDVDALPADLKEGLEILPAATVQEAVQMAMGIKQTQL